MAWNPERGFYVSTVVLDAPWEEEVAGLDTKVGQHLAKACIEGRNFDDYLTFISFKSYDGDPYTKPALPGKGEVPADFIWTSIYHDNPVLRSVIDWFPVQKTRVRLARAAPNRYLQPHFDWDNARHNFEQTQHQVRIFLSLDDKECWYRLSDGVSDMHVRLMRGQFMILDVDQVMHATENRSHESRNNLIIQAKTNMWIRNLPDLFPRYRRIDPRNDDPQ